MSTVVLTPDHQAKIKAWRRQHSALGAPAYRVTLVGRSGQAKDRTINLGKSPCEGVAEHFFNAAEVEGLIPQLRRRNALGFDVYLTPIDKASHYIVIDDMKPGAERLLGGLGYSPCLIQSSSQGNEQAVLKVPRIDRADEQALANKVVRQLNVAHGDPHFSGVIHPFRLAGFSNKKPGKADAFTRILMGAARICEATAQALQVLRDDAAHDAKPARSAVKLALISGPPTGDRGTGAAIAFDRASLQVRAWVKRRGLEVNNSKVDFRAAIAMLAAGWSAEDVRLGMLASSEGLAARHSNPSDYVQRTVHEASLRLAVIAAARPATPTTFPRRGAAVCVSLMSGGARNV